VAIGFDPLSVVCSHLSETPSYNIRANMARSFMVVCTTAHQYAVIIHGGCRQNMHMCGGHCLTDLHSCVVRCSARDKVQHHFCRSM
jgi:hypothetical protein